MADRVTYRWAGAQLWAAFRHAERDAAASPEQVAATRRLVRFLIHPDVPEPDRGIAGDAALVHVAHRLNQSVVWLAAQGAFQAEADARHELALLLHQYAQRLPGEPLRTAAHMALRALRLHRRLRRWPEAAREHHLIGLIFRTTAHGGPVRDGERAIRHLATAYATFARTRPDLAAEAAFSSISAWGRRRVGDPAENNGIARHCRDEAWRLFGETGQARRQIATDLEYARVLFARRIDRTAALSDCVDLLGGVIERLAALPEAEDAAQDEATRQMRIEAFSLLGEVHRNRPARTRCAAPAAACFAAVERLLRPEDDPAVTTPHRLRRAVFLVEEALAGRATWDAAQGATAQARAAAAATTDTSYRLAALYWEAVVLVERGADREALRRFEAVTAGRLDLVGGVDDPFGIEARAEVASGLAAAAATCALRVAGPEAAIRLFERARVSLRPIRHDDPPCEVDAARIAAACPTGGALVWLLVSRGRSAAVIACRTAGGLHLESLPLARLDDRRMRAAQARWLQAILAADGTDPTVAVAGMRRALERLLADLGARLTRRLDRRLRGLGLGLGEDAEVVLIATGAATLLPVQAAPIGGGRCFADRYALRLAPTLALAGDATPTPTRSTTARAVILTDPSGLGPAGLDEAERLTGLFRAAGLRGPRILESLASRTALGAALAGAPVVHVTAHGQFGFHDPLRAGIAFGDRTLGPAQLLASADLRGCALAFLASCESALADAGRGDDLLTGLAATCLDLGAASVVGALWPVADAPAARLVDGFYRRFLAGEAPAAALRAAMLATRVAYPHPFDWAPFLVHGR